MAGTASRCRQDTGTASGCWGKLGFGLGGTRARPDPGDSCGFWHGVNVGDLGAVSVARVRFECAGFGVRIGLGAESETRVVLVNESSTRVRFVVTGSGTRLKFVGIGTEAWVRFEGTGSGARVRLVSTGTEAWVRFDGTGTGA